MQTKVVQHVPRINIKHLTYDSMTTEGQHDILEIFRYQLLSNDIFNAFYFELIDLKITRDKRSLLKRVYRPGHFIMAAVLLRVRLTTRQIHLAERGGTKY